MPQNLTSTLSPQVLEGHTRPVLSLAWSATHLFSGSYDHTIRVWDLNSLQKVTILTGASFFFIQAGVAEVIVQITGASTLRSKALFSADALSRHPSNSLDRPQGRSARPDDGWYQIVQRQLR